jgi:glycine/serine hydroxymethyltransferase
MEGRGDYRELYKKLMANSITTAFDHPDILGGGLFIRLGTQEITRRGMKEKDMEKIAGFLDRTFKGERLQAEVEAFVDQYRRAHYSFDSE